MYWAALSADLSTAAESAIEGTLYGPLRVGGGARLGLSPVAPEVFVRATLRARLGLIDPRAGLELGVTGRGAYERESGVLGELRGASRSELVPIYGAIVATPIHFAIAERWSLSLLQLHIGTHLAPLGRYVRLQVSIVAVGMTL